MNEQPENILVWMPNWVGDNIFAQPALRKLREMYPEAHLAVLVRAPVSPLWEMVPEVDEVITHFIWGESKGFREKWNFIQSLRLRRFDLAVILTRSFESAVWMRTAGIPGRWGYREEGRGWLLTRRPKSPAYRKIHRIDYFYRLLNDGADDGTNPVPRLEIPSETLSNARKRLEQVTGHANHDFLAGIHPGAGQGPAKFWPPQNYMALAEWMIREKGATVLVFGERYERALVEPVVRAAGPRAVGLAGRTDLKELASLIKLCRVMVTNDTGPLHLAAALDVPAVGIYGPTDPGASGPRGNHMRLIFKEVHCSPCLKKVCPTDHICMTSVTVDEVISEVERLLQ